MNTNYHQNKKTMKKLFLLLRNGVKTKALSLQVTLFIINITKAMNYLTKITAVTLMLLASASLYSQDVIVTKAGDVIPATEIEIGPSSVFYKAVGSDGGMQKISKADVLAINKKDGTKIKMDDGVAAAPAPAANAGAVPAPAVSEAAKVANEARIRSYNDRMFTVERKISNKKGKIGYCKLSINPQSTMENDDVALSFTTTPNYVNEYTTYQMVAKVTNKTSKTIYLDLANSFFVRGDEARPYYVPSSTTTTNISSSGGAVNMGAVAGALGIGGSLGTLARGVTVGGANTQGTTTVEYSQRIVSIPPHSAINLPEAKFFYNGMRCFTVLGRINDGLRTYFNIEGLMAGDVIHWNENDSPIQFKVIVSYASDEALSAVRNVNTSLYVSDLLGIGRSADNGSPLQKAFGNLSGDTAPLFLVITNKAEYAPMRIDINTLNVEHLQY